MPKYTAKVVIHYDGEIGVEPHVRLTQAKRNEMMRDVVWIQVADALKLYGLDTEVVEVRRVQSGKSKIDA